MSIPKGQPGREWKSLFLGDDDGIRCLKQPYIMTETEEEVILEFELPFWIDKDDCKVEIGTEKLIVKVRGEVNVCRTYWRDLEQEQKGNYVGPVDISNSMWSLDDEIAGNGERVKVHDSTYLLLIVSILETIMRLLTYHPNSAFQLQRS